MPVFEPIHITGTALYKALCAWVLLGSLCGSALAQTPLVLAIPDDNPARNARLSLLQSSAVRVVPDTARMTGTGIMALDGAKAAIAQAVLAGWDIIALDEASEIAACAAGVLQKAPTSETATADISARFARRPGQGGATSGCALTYDTRFEALAYRLDAFVLSPPSTGLAVFDTVSFPGPRAVVWPPRALLEWAILAQGVPEVQVYDILSSARGMQIARAAILEIAPSIIWVESDAEAARLLATGQVTMAVAGEADLAVTAGIAVVVQAGKIGQRRSWIQLPSGAAPSTMPRPTDGLVAALAGDQSTYIPVLWRDAAWYAQAGAHVATGLSGLGPEN